MQCYGIAGTRREVVCLRKKRGFVKVLGAHEFRHNLPENEIRILPAVAIRPLLSLAHAVPGDQLARGIGAVVCRAAAAALDSPEKGIGAGGGMMPVLNMPVLPVHGSSVEQIKINAVRG